MTALEADRADREIETMEESEHDCPWWQLLFAALLVAIMVAC